MRKRIAAIAATAALAFTGMAAVAPAATAATKSAPAACNVTVNRASAGAYCATYAAGTHFTALIGCTDGRNYSTRVTLQGQWTSVYCGAGDVRAVTVHVF